MAHLKFKFETLNAFCNEAFEKFGFTSDESKTITDVLLLSDVYGIEFTWYAAAFTVSQRD